MMTEVDKTTTTTIIASRRLHRLAASGTMNKSAVAIFLVFTIINSNLIKFVNGIILNSDSDSDSSNDDNLFSSTNSNYNHNNKLINFQICNLNGNDSALKQLSEKLVQPEKEFSEYLDKDKTKRYTITLAHASPLTINITSMCHKTTHLTLSWNLFYRNKINFDNLLRENINHSEIIEFKCLPGGKYDFLVTSIGENSCKWKILYRLAQYNHNWPYLNLTKPIKIHLKNRQQKRQIVVKWEKSKLDIHAINYCMAINREKSYTNLCDAIHSTAIGASSIFNEPEFTLSTSSTSSTARRQQTHTATPLDADAICNRFYTIENLLKFNKFEKIRLLSNKAAMAAAEASAQHTEIICTGFKSQQIFRDFQIKLPYYIDVYAIHTKLNNFSYFLGGLRTIINRTQPLLLREDKTMIHKLNEVNGVFLFSIKLKNSQTTNFQLFVVPCGGGGSINVNITKRKEKILLKNNIYKPTILKVVDDQPSAVNTTLTGRQSVVKRYVIKIRPSTEDDIMRVNKVELTYTTKEYFKEFPVLPKNITIVEFVGARNCRATTIAWYSSPDNRKVKYCIYVLRLSMKKRDFDNVKQISFCKIDTNLSIHEEFQQMYCFYPDKRTELETLRILDLTPDRQYYVHLTASLPNGKSLPYESIRIKTHAKCRKGSASVSSLLLSSPSSNGLAVIHQQHRFHQNAN